MHEWIIAPLLEPDPTGMVAHRSAGSQDAEKNDQQATGDRRHGERRDSHDEDADPDFGRGEDRRDDVV